MIEYILHPIAVKYFQDGINEYCRDSIHYLLELDQWKSNNLNIQNKLIKEDLFIVAEDVIALYPNINKNTLRDASLQPSIYNRNFVHWVKGILLN